RSQLAVLEVLRGVGIDEDGRVSVLDHEVALGGLVLDGVGPRAVDRRMRPRGDSESCSGARVVTDDVIGDGAYCFGRELEHARSMAATESRRVAGEDEGGGGHLVRRTWPIRQGADLVVGGAVPPRGAGEVEGV